MKRCRSGALALVAALVAIAAATPSPARAQLHVDINIPALKLVVWDGQERIADYPIAVGLLEFPTPTGDFTISHAEWNPWWYPPTHREWARNERPTPPGPNNPMGRVKLFFMPLYFIHGTPAGESIGTPASHGCVRMRNEDVIELARLLHERAAPQVSAARLDELARPAAATRRVDFQDEIRITIRYDPVVVEQSEIFVYPDIYARSAVHPESVYQAFLREGYDISELDHSDVRRFAERARGHQAPVVFRIEDTFGRELAGAGH